MRRILAGLTLIVPLAAAQAQEPGPAVATVAPIHAQVDRYLVRAAEQMPESDYVWGPTPEVRTFGQMLGHIVNTRYLYCSRGRGEPNSNQRDYEEITSRAEMVAALRASAEYCGPAFAMTDEAALAPVTMGTRTVNRLRWLVAVSVHDWEHYGNIVTYMRLKGMVPPSSQP